MAWRDRYRVHPVASVFPMMTDAEIDVLAEDIHENGLLQPIVFFVMSHREVEEVFRLRAQEVNLRGARGVEDSVPCVIPDPTVYAYLLDGRNRLEAIERMYEKYPGGDNGVLMDEFIEDHSTFLTMQEGSPVEFVCSLNIHRRHLTKTQQARLIHAAVKADIAEDFVSLPDESDLSDLVPKPPQLEGVSRGGRGRVNEVKLRVAEIAETQGISLATVERAIALDEGRAPPTPARPPVLNYAVSLEQVWNVILDMTAAQQLEILERLRRHVKDRMKGESGTPGTRAAFET